MNYQIKNSQISVVISDIGAEMQSINRENTEYLWNGDATYWSERAPILFPFVGRLTEGKYLLNGKPYEMGIHGFARLLPYSVVEKTDEMITFELTDSEKTYEMYPYHFILRVTYALVGNKIEITYEVLNLSDDTMYFGIGGHPGFRVPLEEGLSFEDYSLEFEGQSVPQMIGFDENGFMNGRDENRTLENGRTLRLTHGMFNDSIVLKNVSDKVTLRSEKGNRKVTLSYPSCPYLGLWYAPQTEAPYVCIEPWVSLPSREGVVEELRCKSDLIRLEEGCEYRNQWSIEVE